MAENDNNGRYVEIVDTTLRDGEQTSGVSFIPQEKVGIARLLLEDLKVNRIEIGSARVSAGEEECVRHITDWAKIRNRLEKVEVLGFVDGGKSVEWIYNAGGRVINLLAKGSVHHLEGQLGKTKEEHLSNIRQEVEYATKKGMKVNLYLEDWSNGMKDSADYVFYMMDHLKDSGIVHFMLPDTLGVLSPRLTYDYCHEMVNRYPDSLFDFHPHNDYDFAVANACFAIEAGIQSIHVTVNGLGERAGNAPLSSVVAALHDQLHRHTSINEQKLSQVSKIVESYSGVLIPSNEPIIGENVFTQCAGIHADGDNKNNLYCNALLPERFGRTREYALGKTSGKASIKKNLQALGIELDEESMKKVTNHIIELGDRKETITQEDLPYIISDVLGHDNKQQSVKILNYFLSLTQNLHPVASIKVEIDNKVYQTTAEGNGQYDAFVKALRHIYKTLKRNFPMLVNYSVTIPPGGRTDAFVQTVITWSNNGKVFRTRGFDGDQTEAAIKATIKMLNIIEED